MGEQDIVSGGDASRVVKVQPSGDDVEEEKWMQLA
jgi:hypothetical protein